MQIRNLGGSGLRVSAVGLGCNNFGQRTDLETAISAIRISRHGASPRPSFSRA
jgi:aryl-alcohol dehydrogenase-like predicted oxidoreductase